MSPQSASSCIAIVDAEELLHDVDCQAPCVAKLDDQEQDEFSFADSFAQDEPERELSPDSCGARNRAQSSLSVATDFDDLTCPGAQAEKCQAYCDAVYKFMPYLQPAMYGRECDRMAMMPMPIMVYGGTQEQLQAQADELTRAAGQLMTAAQQAQEQAITLQMEEQCLNSRSRSSDQRLTHGEGEMQSPPVPSHVDGDWTTVMLRNLPNDYSRDMLLELLDAHGLHGLYNFVYLPIDFKRHAGLGYAFVNMTTTSAAEDMFAALQGFSAWQYSSSKVLELSWGQPLQGLNAHIQRYRNSPVMHSDVPDEFKPLLFHEGAVVDFPPPTKKIDRPRMKSVKA